MTDGLKLKGNNVLLTPISQVRIQGQKSTRLVKHGLAVVGYFLFYPEKQVELLRSIGKTSITQIRDFLTPWGGDFGILKSPWIGSLDHSNPIEPEQRALLDSYLLSLYGDGNLNVLQTPPEGDDFLEIQAPESRRLLREFLERAVALSLGHEDKKMVKELMLSPRITQTFGTIISMTRQAIDEARVNPGQKPEGPSGPSQG